MIVKVHGLGMDDSMVIKTDEIRAEMVNYIKRNMTITLFLTLIHQVDKYFHVYHYKKRWRHMQAQPVIFWGDSQLGLILMQFISTINNFQMDLQAHFALLDLLIMIIVVN